MRDDIAMVVVRNDNYDNDQVQLLPSSSVAKHNATTPPQFFSAEADEAPWKNYQLLLQLCCRSCIWWGRGHHGHNLRNDDDDDDDTARQRGGRRRVAYVLFGCAQAAMFGGLLFGWACIDRTMLAGAGSGDGGDGGDGDGAGAGLSFAETTQIFSWAVAVGMVSSLVLGGALDRYGPRVCSILSHATIALGCALFACVVETTTTTTTTTTSTTNIDDDITSDNFIRVAAAACCISFGGPGIQLATMHVANLFHHNPGNHKKTNNDHHHHNAEFLVTCCFCGSVSVSSSVFAGFDWLWSNNNYGGAPLVTFRMLFGSLTLVVLLSMIASALVWPDEPFPKTTTCKDCLQYVDSASSSLAASAPASARGKQELPAGEYEPIPPPPTECFRDDHDDDVSTTYNDEDDDNNGQGNDDKLSTTILEVVQSCSPSREKSCCDDDDAAQEEKTTAMNNNYKFMDETTTATSRKTSTFAQQLWSATYLQSLLFFIVTCFMANFYVASISTEMADDQFFSAPEQHQLARIFTLILSSGTAVSVLLGLGMGYYGSLQARLMLATLVLGMLHQAVLVLMRNSVVGLVFSFVLYVTFRQSLFPVFICSLTSGLGFEYFGSLSGIGFAAAGLAQSFIADLVRAVQGDCHLQQQEQQQQQAAPGNDELLCNHGSWTGFHVMNMLLLGALILLVHLLQQTKGRRPRLLLFRKTEAGGDHELLLKEV